MSVPSASFGWSCTDLNQNIVQIELSANRRDQVWLTVEKPPGVIELVITLSRAQASALGAAIQLALLAVPEMEDDINEVHNQGGQG